MGYMFALLAVAAGAAKGYCGKRTSGLVIGFAEAMLANCIRMCLCIVIGFLLLGFQGQVALLQVDRLALLIMVGSGIATSAFVVSWIIAVKRSAYMMLDIFLLLGVLVPMVLCKWLYAEPISGAQWIGLGILVAAVFVMCSYSAGIKGKFSIGAYALLLLCGLASGLADFCQKSYAHFYPHGNAAVFNFYTYVVAAVVLGACYLLSWKKGGEGIRPVKEIVSPIFGYVAVMAICLFAHSYFKVLASGYLTATQLFPLLQGSGIAVSTLMSALFFKERVNLRCVTGLVLAFGALLIMNLL